MRRRQLTLAIAALLVLAALAIAAFGIPDGVTAITQQSSERRNATVPANITAQGGNITRINVSYAQQTQVWQGFAGNITGAIVLQDAGASTFYRWSMLNITGEIYASRNGTINFNNIYPQNNCSIDQALTNTYSDRVNRTYNASANYINFSVGTIAINSTTACAARPFVNSTDQYQLGTNLFENVILSPETNYTASPVVGGNQTIYTGILQNSNVNGYDSKTYNFQLLVPVNRTTGFATYFFYAEMD